MNKITLIVSLIIVGLLLLALGAGFGVLYQTQQAPPQLEKTTTAAVNFLSSKIFPSIVAYGKVTKIEGKNITLSSGGDSIKISMEENSPVYSFVYDSAQKPVQKKIEFKEIKVGDNLNITIKFLPDGQLQGQSVYILLPFSAPVKAK